MKKNFKTKIKNRGRKVLSFMLFFQWAMCFVIKKPFLTIESLWTDAEHWFSFNVGLFLPKTWSYDFVPLIHLDFLHKKNSSSKIWSPHKFGSIWLFFVVRNFTSLRNPLHKASWNWIFPNFAEPNRMTFLCLLYTSDAADE